MKDLDKIMTDALLMIGGSCLADFETPLEWAQWCRDVAIAAKNEDEEELEILERVQA